MSYSESELELDSDFAINSVSELDSDSGSGPESDCSSAFMNLLIFVFLLCIYILQKKLPIILFFGHHNRINSYTGNARLMLVFSWYFIT